MSEANQSGAPAPPPLETVEDTWDDAKHEEWDEVVKAKLDDLDDISPSDLLMMIVSFSDGLLDPRYEKVLEVKILLKQHPRLKQDLRELLSNENPKYKAIRTIKILHPSKSPDSDVLINETTHGLRSNYNSLEAAWNEPYQGNASRNLLDKMNEEWSKQAYGNATAFIQSSGSGKSRMCDELAKQIVTIPINVRDPADNEASAYPPPDIGLYKLFQRLIKDSTWEDLQEATKAMSTFFEALFIVLENLWGKKSHTAVEWRKYLLSKGTRKRLYDDVIMQYNEISTKKSEERCKPAPPTKPATDASPSATDSTQIALEQLLNKISGSSGGISETKELELFVYFDEAHTLASEKLRFKTEDQGPWTLYDVLLRAASGFRNLPVFLLAVSTAPKISQLAPNSRIVTSARRTPDVLATPFTETPFDCDPLFVSDPPHGLSLPRVQEYRFLVRFGRPLWWTLYNATSREIGDDPETEVRKLAKFKLTGQKFDHFSEWTSNSSENRSAARSKLAVLDCILSLDYDPSHDGTLELHEAMVASHMRTVFAVSKSREDMFLGYPSEPVLSLSALEIVRHRTEHEEDPMAGFFSHVENEYPIAGPIDAGQRGENVGKMLLMRAYLDALNGEDPKQGCSVNDFLGALISDVNFPSVLDCLPDVGRTEEKLSDAFKNSWVRFTHFARAGDDGQMSTICAAPAFVRGMAIIRWHSQKMVDVLIPVLLDKNAAIREKNMTGILVQFKVGKDASSPPIEFSIDADAIGFFWTPECKRPYISLVMELGVQLQPKEDVQIPILVSAKAKEESRTGADKSLGKPGSTRSMAKTGSGSLAMPSNITQTGASGAEASRTANERPGKARSARSKAKTGSEMNSGGPATPSKIMNTSATRTQAIRNSVPRQHSRYALCVQGCSPTVYKCINEVDRIRVGTLLYKGGFVPHYTRPESVREVLEQKPFFLFSSASYSWYGDPLIKGWEPRKNENVFVLQAQPEDQPEGDAGGPSDGDGLS